MDSNSLARNRTSSSIFTCIHILAACPRGLGLTQPPPAAPLSGRGRDSATQLGGGDCQSQAPLVPASPVDEEKCIHRWAGRCHRHLNSNHSSFLPRRHCR
ncbi:unnamed protein product [Pleuronectes platessa]|uniref:Uncharacterized protein n=1 Tax=Pleuronectes platessa TaxID=8262 RepID=A0A9N7Y4V1_PLEPL|nr:unnamed protein product [Pleuronectes platessa]